MTASWEELKQAAKLSAENALVKKLKACPSFAFDLNRREGALLQCLEIGGRIAYNPQTQKWSVTK